MNRLTFAEKMPTKKQLHFMMQSDFEFGHPKVRGSEHDAIGERSSTGVPEWLRRQRENPQGKVIAKIVIDPETGTLRIKPLKD